MPALTIHNVADIEAQSFDEQLALYARDAVDFAATQGRSSKAGSGRLLNRRRRLVREHTTLLEAVTMLHDTLTGIKSRIVDPHARKLIDSALERILI